MAKDKSDGMANEGPFFVEGYRGVILAKQARKWKRMYLSRKGGLQPISVFEEILDEDFPDKCEASLTDLSGKLRIGGFTMPFLERMMKHFQYVSSITKTPPTLPLHYTVRRWAQILLIECVKEHLFDSSVPFATKQSLATSPYRTSLSSEENDNRKSTSSKGKKPASSSTSSAPTPSSSSSKTSQTSNFPRSKVKASVLLKNDSSNEDGLIWKGVGPHDLEVWQAGGMKWNRRLRSRGGDLSAAPAIYYTNNARYALAWGGYIINPVRWEQKSLEGAIIFEANLQPTQLSQVRLPNTSTVQDWLTSNFTSCLPYDESRTAPPGSTNAMLDIIWGPLRQDNILETRPMNEQLGLTDLMLQQVKQVGFCTDAAVLYVNSCFLQIYIVEDDLLSGEEESGGDG